MSDCGGRGEMEGFPFEDDEKHVCVTDGQAAWDKVINNEIHITQGNHMEIACMVSPQLI